MTREAENYCRSTISAWYTGNESTEELQQLAFEYGLSVDALLECAADPHLTIEDWQRERDRKRRQADTMLEQMKVLYC